MDCSTFAFDLHVLGTPPALILSQDQTLKLNSLSFHFLRSSRCNCLTQVSLLNWLSDCLCQVRWFTALILANPAKCHPLILDGLCACTFYLVFKEPSLLSSAPLRHRLSLGEPSKTIARLRRCQLKSCVSASFFVAGAVGISSADAPPDPGSSPQIQSARTEGLPLSRKFERAEGRSGATLR